MPKEKSRPYPATTWSDCKALLERIRSLGVDAVSADALASEYGLSSSRTKSFQYRISTAKQYGLIDIRSQTISVTEAGRDILYPVEEDVRLLELRCFVNPLLNKMLVQKFDSKSLPRTDLLENTLVKECGVVEGAKKRAAECFISSAKELGILSGGVLCYARELERHESTESGLGSSSHSSRSRFDSSAEGASDPPRAVLEPRPSASSPGAVVQEIPLASGGVLEFSIPVTATRDELLLARDIFDIILKRRFGLDRL